MAHEVTTHERLTAGYTGRLFAALTVGYFAIMLGKRLLPPLLPVIIEDLAITAAGAGIALSALNVMRAGTQYPGGRIADQLTRKTVLIGSLALAILGFGLLTFAVTFWLLLVGVSILGAALGAFVPADRALLSDLFEDKRGRAFGFHFSASDVTGILAAGGAVAVVAVGPWQLAFVFAIPVLAAVILLLHRWGREEVRIDRVDIGVRETVGRLFGTPRFRWVVAAYSFRTFATQSVTNFLPAFLVAAHGFSFAFASGAFALRFAVGLVAKPSAGILADRISRPGIAVVSLFVTGLGIVLLIVAPSVPLILGGVIVYAVGQKSFSTPMQAYLMDSFPDDSMGGDFGATRATYMGVGSLSPAVIGFIAAATSFPIAYATTLLFVAIAAGMVLWLELQ